MTSDLRRGAVARAAILAVANCVGVIAIMGCNVLPDAPRELGNCAVAVELWLRHPNQSRFEFVRIEGGVLGYSAGRDALLLKPSWQTDLTPQQCAEILDVARQGGWLSETPPANPPAKGEFRADLAVAWADGSNQFATSGSDATVAKLMAIIKPITDERFRRALDRLPEAGAQKR